MIEKDSLVLKRISRYERTKQKEIRDFKLNELKILQDFLTEPQKEMFKKIYPVCIDLIPNEKLKAAIKICEDAVEKNLGKVKFDRIR